MHQLPLVNVFQKTYEVWTYRKATQEEITHFNDLTLVLHGVKDKLIYSIQNHYQAAEYILTVGADNGLEFFIDDFLTKSKEFKDMRKLMPSQTPKSFFDYQQKYPKYNRAQLTQDMNQFGKVLSDGQILFHGGSWFNDDKDSLILNEPLSTSFCPQVALRNAEWGGKAYDRGRIDLFVLRATTPKTRVFVYRQKGTRMGNEKEVLFNSGAQLILRKETLVKDYYNVGKGYPTLFKKVPVYVLEIDVI